jgi:hypothetical protein
MFFKKKSKDCIELISANKSIIGKPFHDKFLTSASYSYPSHKDKDVMDRIFDQKKLIDGNGVFETVLALARNTAYGDEFIKFSDRLIQDVPRWSDKLNYSQTSTTFVLNGSTYTAEQHSSNFNSLVCLYKNNDLIFGATLIGHQGDNIDSVAIASSKLTIEEIQLLIDFANLSAQVSKQKRDASWNSLMEKDLAEHESRVKQNF